MLSLCGPRQRALAPEITGTASNLNLSLTPGRLHSFLCPGLVPCNTEGWTMIDLMNVEPTSMTQILGSMSVVSCSILIRPFSMTGC